MQVKEVERMPHDPISHIIGIGTSLKRRLLSLCMPVGVFACAFLFLFATMPRLVDEYDEGLILFGSTRVLSGDVPYRDFYANYGPAQFYVLATLFKIFGPSVLIERLWDVFIRAGTVLVIYLIVDGTWSRGRALFAALVTSIWLSNFGTYGFPVFPCLLFSLLSLYFVVPIYRGCRAVAPLVASGLCGGVTILFRHDVGIATAVGSMFTLGLFHMTLELDPPAKFSALLRSATIYAGGVVIALGPPLVLLVSAGSAHDMLVDLILIPARTYVRTRSLPFPSVVAIASEMMHLRLGSLNQLAVYLPIVAVSLGIMTALTSGRNQRCISLDEQAIASQRRWILVQLSVFSLLFFFKGWVRVSPLHMALAIVPSLVIITVWQTEFRSGAAKILFAVGIAGVLFLSLAPTRNALDRFTKNLAWAAHGPAPSNGVLGFAGSENGSCFPPAGLERIRCFYISWEQIAAIRYIQEHTAANEGIFVGLTRHDKIFTNNVLFYFLCKRPSVTRWHHFDPGVQTTMEVQSEMVNELQSRPRYVVLSSEWDNVNEPNESARSSGVTVLDQYIRANYRGVAAFGPLTVLEHQPD
jgi:hypothetical protein